METHKHNDGFLLISLMIVLAIMAILFVVMYGKSRNGGPSTAQTYQNDIQAAKQVTNLQNQQTLDIQNQLNSPGGAPASIGHRAIQQAKGLQSQSSSGQQY